MSTFQSQIPQDIYKNNSNILFYFLRMSTLHIFSYKAPLYSILYHLLWIWLFLKCIGSLRRLLSLRIRHLKPPKKLPRRAWRTRFALFVFDGKGVYWVLWISILKGVGYKWNISNLVFCCLSNRLFLRIYPFGMLVLRTVCVFLFVLFLVYGRVYGPRVGQCSDSGILCEHWTDTVRIERCPFAVRIVFTVRPVGVWMSRCTGVCTVHTK